MMTVNSRGGDPPYPPMFAIGAPDRKNRDFIRGADGELKPRELHRGGGVTPLGLHCGGRVTLLGLPEPVWRK